MGDFMKMNKKKGKRCYNIYNFNGDSNAFLLGYVFIKIIKTDKDFRIIEERRLSMLVKGGRKMDILKK